MIKLIRGLVTLVAGIVVVLLAISNRGVTDVGIWPLSQTVELPIYGVFLVGLVAGALLGGFLIWLGGHARRSEAVRMKRKVVAIEHQRAVRERQEEEAMSQDSRGSGGQMVARGAASG